MREALWITLDACFLYIDIPKSRLKKIIEYLFNQHVHLKFRQQNKC